MQRDPKIPISLTKKWYARIPHAILYNGLCYHSHQICSRDCVHCICRGDNVGYYGEVHGRGKYLRDNSKKLGVEKKYLIVVMMTFIYGFLGISVGYENNIAVVPIAAVMSLVLGGDLVLAAGISVGAMTIGFGISLINPYTVGIGHKIAQLPMF